MQKDPVTLTAQATHHLVNLCAQYHEQFIKLSVTTKGCSGNSYKFEFTKVPGLSDHQIQISDDCALLLDGNSFMFILGTTIDWVEDQFGAHFKFDNPRITATCGCGESYHFN